MVTGSFLVVQPGGGPPMPQTDTTQPTAKAKAKAKPSLAQLAREALIVFAITGAISVAVGLLPRFN